MDWKLRRAAVLRRLSYDVILSEAKDLPIGRGFCCDAGFSFPAQMLHFVQHDKLLMGRYRATGVTSRAGKGQNWPKPWKRR